MVQVDLNVLLHNKYDFYVNFDGCFLSDIWLSVWEYIGKNRPSSNAAIAKRGWLVYIES